MKDRIPTYPGRVKLTPVSGQTNIYDMVRADEPVQEGTPLNKATLLSDATASALGLSDATVDEALGKLKNGAFLNSTPTRTRIEKASQLPVGASIPVNVDGVAKNFIVIQQGRPSDVYDDSCSGTWLMMEELYAETAFDASDNDYQNSDVHAYLNNNFFGLLDANIQASVKTAKIPYWNGQGYGGSLATGADGLSAKVFLLSCIETGANGGQYMPTDGAAIGYFTSDKTRIAYNSEGTKKFWWTRSPAKRQTGGAIDCWCVTTNGSVQTENCAKTEYWARPVFVLSDDADVSYLGYYKDANDSIHDEQEYSYSFADVLGNDISVGTKIETGSYIGTGYSGYSYPNSITFSGVPKLVFISRNAFLEFDGNGQFQNSVLWQDGGDGNKTSPSVQFVGSSSSGSSFVRNGNTLTWQVNTNNTTSAAQGQLNSTAWKYFYFAVLE